jgi:hypothetical protein
VISLFEQISLIPLLISPESSPSWWALLRAFFRHFISRSTSMATMPTTVTSTSAGFQSAFKHVRTTDRHADSLACVAIIASTTLEDVFKKAEELGMPKVGPYNHVLDDVFLASLLAQYGWVATVWKECTSIPMLPDLCLALVDYDAVFEIGRFVVCHKAKASHDAKMVTYAIDPLGGDQKQQVRTDIDVLKPAWYIGVHAMAKTTTAPAKK